MKKCSLVALVLVGVMLTAEAIAQPPPLLAKWGTYGSGEGEFVTPFTVAVDVNGNVYVSDWGNPRIQKFSSTGTWLATWGSAGSENGQFLHPMGIAVDASGNVYVADAGNDRIQKFSDAGVFLTSWGTTGSGDGEFNGPVAVAVDPAGNVYVADFNNNRIQKFTGTGTFLAAWGSAGTGDGQFEGPKCVAVGASGVVYVTEEYGHRVQKFTSTGAFLAKWGSAGSGNGEMSSPYGVAESPSGYVYVADTGNHRIQVFTRDGTFVLTWGSFGSGDGEFYYPTRLAIDATGDIYVVDQNNYRIQKFGAPPTLPTTTHAVYVEPPYTLTNCAMAPTVAFRIDQMGMTQNIRGYEIKFSVIPSFATVANPSTDIVQGSYLSSIGTTMFSAMSTGGGNYTVSCAILGGATGATGDGELFTVKLTPAAAGASDVAITSMKLRDIDNGELTVIGENGSIRIDCTAPAPPTNFHALPGNQKVHLTWTNPSDLDFAGVEIRRVAWGDYPEYGTTVPPGPGAPSYPANHSAGDPVTLATGTSYDDMPLAPRGIYYYAAFSKDLAGNYSVLGSSATDRSTNYWLGDVTADGNVDMSDLVTFSGAFGSSYVGGGGGGGWNNICDFGPTSDWSRLGIPLPDNKIDFEDLMIFAMNWGNVTPAGLGTYVATHVVEDLSSLVKFDIVPNDDNTISIVLRNRAEALKGVHVVVNVSGADLQKVNRGSVFAGRSDLFFGTLPATAGDADICAAALGVGTPLTGSGEIARLIVKPTGNSPAVVTIKAVDLRNVDNEKTEITTAEQHETPFVPKATVLMQNFPNPFNPVTTLTFDAAQAGSVTIAVYDVSGRLVATLLNARVEVGRHHVEWNGKNSNGSLVPSGIYFYRMKTAGYEATKKMILVR